MANQVETIDIRDTAAHNGIIQDFQKNNAGILKVVNGLNEDVSIEIETNTFDDPTFTEAVSFTTKLVSAGATEYVSVVGAWKYTRMIATAALTPISGMLKLVWEFKKEPVDPDVLTESDKGVANGVCPLDNTTHIPIAFIPSSLLGGYQGPIAYNDPVPIGPNNGDNYRFSSAGTCTWISPVGKVEVGDIVIYDSTTTEWNVYQGNLTVGDLAGEVQANGADLGASHIVETDGAKKFITAAKNTAFNKDFGTSAGTVTEGDKAALLGGRSGGQNISGGDFFGGVLNLKSKMSQTVGVRVASGAKLGVGFSFTDSDPTEKHEIKDGNLKFIGTKGRVRDMLDPALPQDADTEAARDAAILAHQPKAGIILTGGWDVGNPKKVTITFTTAYSDNNYAITITGEDSRSWNIETKTKTGFTINSGSNIVPPGNTFWTATTVHDP